MNNNERVAQAYLVELADRLLLSGFRVRSSEIVEAGAAFGLVIENPDYQPTGEELPSK